MNQARLQLLHARAYYDLAAAQSAALVVLGSRLGLYEALSRSPRTAPELAAATGVDERYLKPWLINQVASDFITKDPASGRYSLDPEQREVFGHPGGPHALAAGFALTSELARYIRDIEAAMRAGEGLPQAARDERLRAALADLEPDKGAGLLTWLPADCRASLEKGADVLEIGCGDGALLRALASIFPKSRYRGLDADSDAIERARVESMGQERVAFEGRDGVHLPAGPWDLVLALETLHEVADPGAVAQAVRLALAPGGAWLVSEPLSSGPDDPSPSTRLLSSLELQFCLPSSLARGGAGLGPLTSPDVYIALLSEAGFGRVARIETPGRLALEARP